jgi:hypothetical protein
VELADLRVFDMHIHERDRQALATAVGLLQWGRLREEGDLSVIGDIKEAKTPQWLKRLYSLLFP